MGAFEWAIRVVMLVLAGLVTLAILGSIAAMSEDGRPGGFTVEADRPLVEGAPSARPEPAAPPADPGNASAPPGDGTVSVAPARVAAAETADRPERWLEAIAYALLALAGLAALMLLLLWQILRELRRRNE